MTMMFSLSAAALAAANSQSAIRKHVVVLEKAPEFAEVGAGIQLGPNSQKMFKRLGVIEEINAISAIPDDLMMRDSISAGVIAQIPAREEFRKRFGYPSRTDPRLGQGAHPMLQYLAQGANMALKDTV